MGRVGADDSWDRGAADRVGAVRGGAGDAEGESGGHPEVASAGIEGICRNRGSGAGRGGGGGGAGNGAAERGGAFTTGSNLPDQQYPAGGERDFRRGVGDLPGLVSAAPGRGAGAQGVAAVRRSGGASAAMPGDAAVVRTGVRRAGHGTAAFLRDGGTVAAGGRVPGAERGGLSRLLLCGGG